MMPELSFELPETGWRRGRQKWTLRMTLLSHSRLGTEGADQLIQRLCISFVNYATAYSDQRGQIRFPFGWCNLEAHGATLHITAGAEDPAGLGRVEGIVIDRLKRVARRQRRELIWASGESCNSFHRMD